MTPFSQNTAVGVALLGGMNSGKRKLPNQRAIAATAPSLCERFLLIWDGLIGNREALGSSISASHMAPLTVFGIGPDALGRYDSSFKPTRLPRFE